MYVPQKMATGWIQLYSVTTLCLWILLDIRCTACGSTRAPTTLETFHGHVLKRRTRSVVFPNKAQLLLTPAFTKAILGGIPRGLSYSVEFDMYSALPDTIEGWQPTILVNKIKKEKELEQYQQLKEAAKLTTTTEKSGIAENYSETLLEYANDYEHLNLGSPELYQFPFHEDVYSDNSWANSHSKIDSDPKYFLRLGQYPHTLKSSNKYTTAQRFHKAPFRSKSATMRPTKKDGGSYYNAVSSEFHTQAANTRPYLRHSQNYRERRHIFDQLETVGKLVNINMKSCIQRAMCEVGTHLKPFGESLMDDLIRIILTIPDNHNSSTIHSNDDYTHRYSNVNCAHRFAASCPYGVMEFLTQDLKSNMR